MRIYHEAPLAIFERVKKMTDGDYALVHLCAESEEYAQKFRRVEDRHIILDNSIFELGTSFEMEDFSKWILDLLPNEYIVPDTLEDASATCRQFAEWMKYFWPHLPGKPIGVLQGKNTHQLYDCYQTLHALGALKIAISFDYSFWLDDYAQAASNEWEAMMLGRAMFIESLKEQPFFDRSVPIHLLGCALPQEMKFYTYDQDVNIESVDTSNPVLHGLMGIRYSITEGLKEKNTTKIADVMFEDVSDLRWEDIKWNMQQFHRYVNGMRSFHKLDKS